VARHIGLEHLGFRAEVPWVQEHGHALKSPTARVVLGFCIAFTRRALVPSFGAVKRRGAVLPETVQALVLGHGKTVELLGRKGSYVEPANEDESRS
jgi:hypothetical protein